MPEFIFYRYNQWDGSDRVGTCALCGAGPEEGGVSGLTLWEEHRLDVVRRSWKFLRRVLLCWACSNRARRAVGRIVPLAKEARRAS